MIQEGFDFGPMVEANRFEALSPDLLLASEQEAVVKLALGVLGLSIPKTPILSDPQSVRDYFRLKLAHYQYEVFYVLFLNNQNRLITCEEMFQGTIDGAAVYPRDVVRRTLELNAASLILAHNHPSGVVEPSSANIEFSGAEGVLLGEEGKGADVLDKALDTGRILLSAEMLGGLQECFERTIEYLKVREQFGIPIGSFQALKHRAAQMFCEVELSKSVVLEALSALDEDLEDTAELASLAKARLNDTYNLVSSEGVQMHGGIGMTDEYEIGFFMKRSRVSEHTYGNSAFHRNRYGELQGY